MGRDGVFATWDIKKKQQKRFSKLECGADCVGFSKCGKELAIGMTNSFVLFLKNEKSPTKSYDMINKTQISKQGTKITAIKYSEYLVKDYQK